MDITSEVKNNAELVFLMDEKFPNVEWTAWNNEEKNEASFATWNEKGDNFRRDYAYFVTFDIEHFIAVVIDELKNFKNRDTTFLNGK